MILAPFSLFHPSPDQPAETDRGEQLQVKILLPGLVADILEGKGACRSGVVDEHVDLAEIGNDPVMGAGDVGSLRNIANIIAHRESVLRERLARGFQIGSPAREDRDLGAGLSKPARHRDPDALAAAGYNGDAVLHRQVHCCFSLGLTGPALLHLSDLLHRRDQARAVLGDEL